MSKKAADIKFPTIRTRMISELNGNSLAAKNITEVWIPELDKPCTLGAADGFKPARSIQFFQNVLNVIVHRSFADK